jgi:hypothetical protein
VVNATFGAAPSTVHGVDGRTDFTFNTTPGATGLTDHVAVINYTHKTEELTVYPVDAVSSTNGAISYPGQFAKRDQAGAWMSIGTPNADGKITIKPRSTDILPIHVSIPANAPPGDHVGAIVIALNGLVSGRFGNHSAQKINFAQRIAIKTLFNIAGPKHPNLQIEHLHAAYSGPIDPFAKGKVKVTYQVHNAGNVVLGGPQTVKVSGLFGESLTSKGLAAVPALLPGATYPVSVTIPSAYPEVFMSAKVTIATEGLPGDVDPGLRPVSSSVHFFAIPWILLIVLLLLILGLGWRYWRHRQSKRSAGRHREQPSLQGASA